MRWQALDAGFSEKDASTANEHGSNSMTVRGVLLKVHLWLGLIAALFLVILGLTGSVIAFEGDIVHWTHPGLFYVKPGAHTLPEQELIRAAERRFAPARVGSVQVFRQANLVRVMQMTDKRSVFINPCDGSILGSVEGGFAISTVLGYIHQIHLRLVPNPQASPGLAGVGKVVVSYAGLILCLLVPTGVILFWRTRRTKVKWSAAWSRVCFDLHHVIGIYAALFLFVAAFTGILIGFESGEKAIYAFTGSQRPTFGRPPQSKVTPGATPITADQAIVTAHRAIADATVAGISVPANPKAAWTILLRVPEDTSETVHSSVVVDQYSGEPLQVRNFLTDSNGYRVIRFNRSIHTGDVLGLPTHIVMSLSSLALVAMAVTGIVIWAKKLAI